MELRGKVVAMKKTIILILVGALVCSAILIFARQLDGDREESDAEKALRYVKLEWWPGRSLFGWELIPKRVKSVTTRFADNDVNEIIRLCTKLRRLEELTLDVKPSKEAKEQIGSVSSLRHLSLIDVGITNEDLAALKGLSKLEILWLSGNKSITDDGLQELASLTKLNNVDLSYTGINGQGLRHLSGLSELIVLNLERTQCTDETTETVGQMTSLEYLYLSGTKITDDGLKNLKSLNKIGTLWLQGLPITDAGLETLKELPNLRSLWFAEAKVTREGLAKFHAERPEVDIRTRSYGHALPYPND
jgi:Leucine-rich repeat (LRR) protein